MVRYGLPELQFVLWDGFGIRVAVDQRGGPLPRLAILAPTSNLTNNDPVPSFSFGIFTLDFNTEVVSPVLSLQGNPISAGGAAAFDSTHGHLWFVLGTAASPSVRQLYAVDTTTAMVHINRTLESPPGLELLAFDAHTGDIFGVGVTQAAGKPSHFVIARLDADTGDCTFQFTLTEAAELGWTNARVTNVALDAATRTLYFLVSGRPPLMPLNFLTLVAVNVETQVVRSIPSYCHAGSPREGLRNCPSLIGQASEYTPSRPHAKTEY
jgi:hypothetical protein